MIFTVVPDMPARSLVVGLWCKHQPTTREDHMGHAHPSTPAQRLQWASHLLAHAGDYGVVAALSRATGVSRPTLYAWRARAQQALRQVFTPLPVAPVITPALER